MLHFSCALPSPIIVYEWVLSDSQRTFNSSLDRKAKTEQ